MLRVAFEIQLRSFLVRQLRFGRLLAGTVLALGTAPAGVVAAPGLLAAASDHVESVGPLPPSLNGHAAMHREAAPLPPAAAEPYVAPQASEPHDGNNCSFSVNGALDKVFASSDSQVSDKLRGMIAGK